MSKIMFCFAGTGDDGSFRAGYMETAASYRDGLCNVPNVGFNEHVVRIYISGCDHEHVGGHIFFPDLDIVATHIKNAFQRQNEQVIFNLAHLKNQLGDGLVRVEGVATATTFDVESVMLEGFSRGAVTTFAVAKQLDAFDIPLHIFANQPVPGQPTEMFPGSLYSRYHDLRSCRNIHSATLLIGAYHLDNGWFHNTFYRQMVALFSQESKVDYFRIPYQNHLSEKNEPKIVSHHLARYLIDHGFAAIRKNEDESNPQIFLFSYNHLARLPERLVEGYYSAMSPYVVWGETRRYKAHLHFTPRSFLQPILGSSTISVVDDPYYLKALHIHAGLLLKAEEAILKNAIDEFMSSESTLTDEQAKALVAIHKIFLFKDPFKQWRQFIQEKSEAAEKFIKIINEVDSVTTYLCHVTEHDALAEGQKSEKSILIDVHQIEYKKAIFTACYQRLNQGLSHRDFMAAIQKASDGFNQKALHIHRSRFGQRLACLLEFINTMISRVAGLNAHSFLAYKTRSTKEIEKVTRAIASTLS